MSGRPNILLITSDQHRWDFVGTVNPVIKTPNLNRLAFEGITFNRAYTCNPTCTPARASILTGHYPSRHGCYTIGTSLPESYPTIPQLLNESGYYTALLGKAHFEACCVEGNIESAPKIFDRDFFRNWHGPYFGFEHVDLSIFHGTQVGVNGMHYGAWLEDQGIDGTKFFGNHGYNDYGAWNLPEEYHYTKWTADCTISAIDKASSEDKPFFLWCSFQDPHNPIFVPEPWASLHSPSDMPDFKYLDGEFNNKPPFYQRFFQTAQNGAGASGLDLGKNEWYSWCRQSCQEDTPTLKKKAALYAGMISFIDYHIGRILAELKTKGIDDNTVVIFTTDHGDYLGNHGFWGKGLPSYEDVHRVPFIVRHPNVKTPGEYSDSYQSLVDIGTTSLCLAGIDIPPLQQGVDQTESWKNVNRSARNWAMIELRQCEARFMQKTFLHDNWKIVVYHGGEFGEMYDLDNDPNQYNNLWDNPQYINEQSELLKRFLTAEMDMDGYLRPRPMWA